MSKSWVIGGVLAAAMLCPSIGQAQTGAPWLEGRRATSGIGIRAGDLELHPGIAGEVGYNSNFFQGAGDDGDRVREPIVPTLQLRLTPSLALKTLGKKRKLNDGASAAPPKIDFRSRLSGRITQLFALDDQFRDAVSSKSPLLGADLGAKVSILPQREWGADVGANFSRVEQPNNDPSVTGRAFDRNAIGGDFGLRWAPGGGLLQWSLGYMAKFTVYDESRFGLNHLVHGPRTQGRWKFLPRTALLYQGSILFIDHTQRTRQIDANPITTQLGINGLLTSRIALLVMGGWKAMFYRPDAAGNVDDYDGPIGRAEATWYITGGEEVTRGAAQVGPSTLRLGYQRDVANSGIANFYQVDRVYSDLAYSVGGVLLLSLRGGVAFVHHPVPRDSAGTPLTLDGQGLDETRPSASLYAEYRLGNTFALIANTGVGASLEDNFIQLRDGAGSLDNLKFFRYTAFLGARWFM